MFATNQLSIRRDLSLGGLFMMSLYEVSFTMKSLVDLQETTLNHKV